MRADDLRSRGFLARYLLLFGGEALSKAALLLAFAYLARALDPSDYGIVELALSATVFFVLGVESGMGAYGARVAASAPDRLPALVPRVMLLRLIMGVPVYVAVLAASWMRPTPLTAMLQISGVAVLCTPLLTQWVFQGLRQMQWVAAGSATRYLVFAAVVFAFVRPGADVRLVAAAEVAGLAALGLLNLYFLFARLRFKPDIAALVPGTREVFTHVWPLGLSDFLWATLWYSPALVAGWLSGGDTEQVAWIGAGVRIVLALHTFVWLYFFNLLPNLARELSAGLDGWRALVRRSLRTSIWAAALVAVGGTTCAPVLMPAVFGPAFGPAVLPFQIAIWMIPIAWFSGHFRFSLIAAGGQRWELVALLIGAGVTVGGGLVAAGASGSVGAAAALVAGGLANAGAAAWASGRRVGVFGHFVDLVPVVAASAAALGLGLVAGRWWGPVVGAAIASALLMAAAFVAEPELRRFGGRRAVGQ